MSITSKDLKKLQALRKLRADEKRAQMEEANTQLRNAQGKLRGLLGARQQLITGFARKTDDLLASVAGSTNPGEIAMRASEQQALGKRSVDALDDPIRSAFKFREEATGIVRERREAFLLAQRSLEKIDHFIDEIVEIERLEEEQASELDDEETRLSHKQVR